MDETARDLARAGAEAALEHAEREITIWELIAIGWVRAYARNHFHFTTGEVRDYAAGRGFVEAPEARAWGAIMPKAARQQIVRSTNVWTSTGRKLSHGRPERLWESRIYHLNADEAA